MNHFNDQFSLSSILLNEEPTFHQNNESSVSQIDHILYYNPENMSLKVDLHKHLCKLQNFANLSSHDALVGKIEMLLFTQLKLSDEVDYTETYTQFAVSNPLWNDAGIPQYQNQSAQVLRNLAEQFNQPEYIQILAELFSKMLVLTAENNFETTTPSSKKHPSGKTYFSHEHKMSYDKHEQICRAWRHEGHPASDHPAKIAKLESQRNLQRIARSLQQQQQL